LPLAIGGNLENTVICFKKIKIQKIYTLLLSCQHANTQTHFVRNGDRDKDRDSKRGRSNKGTHRQKQAIHPAAIEILFFSVALT